MLKNCFAASKFKHFIKEGCLKGTMHNTIFLLQFLEINAIPIIATIVALCMRV